MLCASKGCGEVQQINRFCSQSSTAELGRFSSAVAETQTTDSLILRFYPVAKDYFELRDRIQHSWTCLANALFSSHARALVGDLYRV